MQFIKTGLFIVAFLTSFSCLSQQENNLLKNPEAKQFIAHMVKTHNFNKEELTKLIGHYSISPEIIKHISNPTESLSWHQYKKLLISKQRVSQGINFIQNHKTALTKAEQQFGVPKEIIAAILGIESYYGTQSGKYPVLQSLSTLAFAYPKRSAFFKQELEHFLLLTKQLSIDPINTKGSYAGAMGPPQFIASSYRNYAIDFDNTGKIDLINNINTAIGSIANYLKTHGWQANKPVAEPAKVSGTKYQAMLATTLATLKPQHSLKQLADYHIKPAANNHPAESLKTQASLLELEGNNKQPEYWLSYNNFYVITTYNKSFNYAMAVYQLSRSIS